ncbi:MAG: hypothetical protein ABSE21_01600 [Bryobacteraceae bacterium]|jgi:hypothetical protein
MLAGDERWAMVQRIVSSALFAKAPQLRDILIYLARRALEDTPAAISELELGRNVLGRRADFNPNEDNIVRVQVRHLRKKLEDYFDTEGRDEPVILTIPKGSYVPSFTPRPEPLPAPPAATDAAAIDASPRALAPDGRAVSGRSGNRWIRPAAGALVLLCLALSAIALRFWKEAAELRAQVPVIEDRIPLSDDVLWSRIFASGQTPTIVVADSCLALLQDILGVDAPLRDLVGNSATAKTIDAIQDKKLQSALRVIATRQYTSLGDLNVVANLLRLSERYDARPRIRYARYLDTREFKSGNFILIGSRRGVPWVQLFEPQLNFYVEQDVKTHSFRFLNRSPQPGEQRSYGSTASGKNQEESYADIAILPNLSGNGYVLIISGITMEATEAAGEMVASREFSSALAKLLRAGPGKTPARYAEVLLQAKTMPGTAGVSRIICHRLVRPQ